MPSSVIRCAGLSGCLLVLACARPTPPSQPNAPIAAQTTPALPPQPSPSAPITSTGLAHIHGATAPNAATSLPPSAAGPDPAVRAHGSELYARMCAVCHGERGQGYKADQAPALAHPDFLATVSDDFLRFAITFGRQGTTMSAWSSNAGGPLSDADIDAVVQFLRSWQTRPTADVDDAPVHGDSVLGQALFQRTCEHCHGLKAKYLHLLSRQLLIKARPGFLRAAIRDGRPNTQMQGYAKTLGEDGIENIVAFLRIQPSWLIPGEIPGTKPVSPLPLGPLPLNPRGRAPANFMAWPLATSIDVVGPAFNQHARLALLDARAPSDYLHQHIAGAVSIPFYDPSPYLTKLPRDTWLVCYCGCPHAESGQLADRLRQAGYTQVTVLDEGFGAWISKGYPTHTGAAP